MCMAYPIWFVKKSQAVHWWRSDNSDQSVVWSVYRWHVGIFTRYGTSAKQTLKKWYRVPDSRYFYLMETQKGRVEPVRRAGNAAVVPQGLDEVVKLHPRRRWTDADTLLVHKWWQKGRSATVNPGIMMLLYTLSCQKRVQWDLNRALHRFEDLKWLELRRQGQICEADWRRGVLFWNQYVVVLFTLLTESLNQSPPQYAGCLCRS